MFLDESYFQGELYLPNLKFRERAVGMSIATQIQGEKDLMYFVKKYEVRFLHKLMGIDMSKAFIEGMEQGADVWDKLYDLIYFQEMGISISPVANYVYIFIRKSERTQASMFGEVRQGEDHSSVVSDRNKLIYAWNDMVRQNKIIIKHIRSNWDTYKQYAGDWWCGCAAHELMTLTNGFGI